MNKLAYISYSQKEANQKIWNSLMDKYKLWNEKHVILGYIWFLIGYILFGFVSVISWISLFSLLFKDIRFTPHYLKTTIEVSNMSQEEIIQYLDSQYADYQTKLSFGNIPLAKQKQIEATFEILYKQYKLSESDGKHEELLSNFTSIQQTLQTTDEKVQTIGKDIGENLSAIKQQTTSISQYTNRKQAEDQEAERRIAERLQKKKVNYNREKGRNLNSFESTLSDEQIDILVKYCNQIPVFKIDVTRQEMKGILLCAHSVPLQTTVNKYVALLFERLSEEKLICKTWKSVAMNKKCFISSNGKELTAKDLSSAHGTSSLIKPEINDLIEECIEKIKES